MKELLLMHGYDEGKTGSPRMIIRLAYSAGMIEDEKGWIELLDKGNEVAHSDNEGWRLRLSDIQRTPIWP